MSTAYLVRVVVIEMKYFTTKQVAKQLSVERQAVYSYIKTGRLNASDSTGKWLISESEIDRFVDTGLKRAKPINTD